MSRTPLRLSLAAVATAAALVPVTQAQAASTRTSGVKAVAAHATSSAAATRRASYLARTGKDLAAIKAVRTARREAVAASRSAKLMLPTAEQSCAAASQAVAGLTTAVQLFGTSLEQFAALTGRTDGPLQQVVAGALPGTIAGRTQLVDLLTQLTQQLDGNCQAIAAQALALLQAAAPGQVAGLADSAALPGLPTDVTQILNTSLAAATAALDDGIAQLAGLLPTLPAAAQAPLAQALGLVQSQIGALKPLVASLPIAGPIVGQVLDLVSHLVGGLTGSLTGTGTTGASGVTGSLPGLDILSGLLGGLGGGSGSGSGSSSGGLLGGLGLGGLLGGLLG